MWNSEILFGQDIILNVQNIMRNFELGLLEIAKLDQFLSKSPAIAFFQGIISAKRFR
jgi:hypothetical protein